MALGVFLLWGRTLLKSFEPNVKPLPSMAEIVQATVKAGYATTPTIVPFTINLVYPTERVIYVPGATPIPPAAEPVSTPIPTKVTWFEDIFIPDSPGIANKPDREPDQMIDGKISYFWPPYAYQKPEYEINCDKSNGVLECEQMASGNLVIGYVGEAIACPLEYDFGTIFKVWDGYYTCRDRGGEIVRIDDQTFWLDILYPVMPIGHYWGEIADVAVWLP